MQAISAQDKLLAGAELDVIRSESKEWQSEFE